MIIIGISGKKLSGKDLVYKISSQLIQAPTIRIAFADILKEEIAKEFNISIEYINKEKDKFRLLLQQWGCLKRELIHQNYWIDQVRNKILSVDSRFEPQVIFITDVRFKNEADWIKSSSGFLVRIERALTTKIDNHISECDLDSYDKFDYTIHNLYTLDVLKKDTLLMLKHIKNSLSTHSHLLMK